MNRKTRGITENTTAEAEYLAMEYLSYKDRTEKEVRDKLRSYKQFDDEVISEAIELLKERGYIDDKKYALEFTRVKAAYKLDGPRKIKYMLMQRGIDGKTAEEAVSEIGCSEDNEIDETANAVTLIKKKAAGYELDYTTKKKIFAYLARKGYSYSVIENAFRIIGSDLDED